MNRRMWLTAFGFMLVLLTVFAGGWQQAVADTNSGASGGGFPAAGVQSQSPNASDNAVFGSGTLRSQFNSGDQNSSAASADNAQSVQQNVQQNVHQEANQQLDQIPTQSIDAYWQKLKDEYGGYLPDTSGPGLVHAILGNGGFHWSNLLNGVLRYFFAEVLDNIRLLGAILVLAVLSAVLASLQAAFEEQTVSQVAYAMIFMVLMLLAIGSFTEAVGFARHAIQQMTDFMLATVPLIVALLAASGAPASAAFFHPVLLFSIHMISNVVFLLVFPLIFFSALLDLTSALSPRYKLTRLAGLLRTVSVSALGLCLTVFVGITTIQGLGKGVADGVTLRTAKFAVGTFVPVVGKALADAATTVASASLLVKNAVGIAGLVIIAFIALFPALKILALSFIYNGSAALMQPLGENAMISCLGSISKSLVLVFASVVAVALMFFIAIGILLASTNLAVIMQ